MRNTSEGISLSSSVTQWEEPESYQPLPPDQIPRKTTELKPPAIASAYSSDAGDPSWWGGGEGGRKRAGEGVEEDEEEEGPRPKRYTGPYGAWKTVALR